MYEGWHVMRHELQLSCPGLTACHAWHARLPDYMQVPSGRLPTAAEPAAPPSGTEGAKPSLRQRLRTTWQQHPVLAVSCVLLFLAVVAVTLGVSIGISARNKGRYPWWAKGAVDSMAAWLLLIIPKSFSFHVLMRAVCCALSGSALFCTMPCCAVLLS
jgi:hypothetical protein